MVFLCFSEVKPYAAKEILEAVQKTITSKSTFSFKEARIITGAEEGTFGWITANYVAGNLGVVSLACQVLFCVTSVSRLKHSGWDHISVICCILYEFMK